MRAGGKQGAVKKAARWALQGGKTLAFPENKIRWALLVGFFLWRVEKRRRQGEAMTFSLLARELMGARAGPL